MLFKILNSKKGMMWSYLIAVMIAILVLVVVMLYFYKGANKGYDGINKQVDSQSAMFDDCDDDGTTNVLDKCPCDPRVGSTWTSAVDEGKDCQQCTDKCG